MTQRKRIYALLLCAGLILSLIVSSAYVVLAMGHPCDGKCCKICENVAKTEALLRSFALFASVLGLAFAALYIPRAFRALFASVRSAEGTLVCWKVRLNN